MKPGADTEQTMQGARNPDSAAKLLVCICPLLVIAAENLEVGRFRLCPVPLQNLQLQWRDQERTDISVLVLKLQLLHCVRKEDNVTLARLFEQMAGEPYGDIRLEVPTSNFSPVTVNFHLTNKEFLKLSEKAALGGDWAFLGPGNNGPDSWLMLKLAEDKDVKVPIDEQSLVQKKKLRKRPKLEEFEKQVKFKKGDMFYLYLGSKLRKNVQGVRPHQVQNEADKCFKVGSGMFWYVTDQKVAGVESLKSNVRIIAGFDHKFFYAAMSTMKSAIAQCADLRLQDRPGAG